MTTTPVRERQQSKLTVRQLAKLRSLLVVDLEETHELVSQLAADLESMSSSRQDVATDDEHDPEGPTLAFERSQMNAVLEDAKVHLSDTEQALVLVDRDEFGLCLDCGERIPFARLEARPFARYCVSCAGRAAR